MIIKPKELSSTNTHLFDYCVVGTGPAGISLALSLSKCGRNVLLLEAGGKDYSDESQSVYKGTVIGDPYHNLQTARLRYFGGTSGHWSGWCRTLDERDYLRKATFKDTAWPITKKDLDPYFWRAAEILEIPSISADILLSESTGIQKIEFVFSTPPVRFGEKYWGMIANSKNIFLCLNANVTCLNSNEKQITSIDVIGYDGLRVKAIANTYIIATGGIENSRLLLWSQINNNGSILPGESPIGCYWMEHPHFTIGEAIIDSSFSGNTYYSLTQNKQDELKILNCSLRLEPIRRKGVKRLINNLACAAPELGHWMYHQFKEELVCGATLRAAWEQEPIKENSIRLSHSENDRFGVPRVELFWKKSKRDIETMRASAIQFGKYMAASNRGRVKLDDWVINHEEPPIDDELGGFHHMGGTRMAEDSSHGVVDKNCKVFGQKNLYIAGSSVFPSGGCANPTLTILQLTLRLADHLLGKR